MSWGKVRGHDRVVEMLERTWRQGRFPHALMFVGPDGIGKRLFARTLAQTFLCERRDAETFAPCGACPACHQVESGTHPDVLSVQKPEEKHELSIDAIRKLNHDLGLRPMRGRGRVAIVDDADDLSEEAANAFLKSLEEPPEGSMMILVGTSTELQLDTILSRCRVVRFEPLAEAELAELLVAERMAEDQEEAERLAAHAGGSVQRALALADPEFAPFRKRLIETLADPKGFSPPALSRTLEAFSKEAGKESALVRQRATLLVAELIQVFRAVVWAQGGRPMPGLEAGDKAAVSNLARRVSLDQAMRGVDRCMEAEYHIARKAYLPLVFDALIHDLAALVSPG